MWNMQNQGTTGALRFQLVVHLLLEFYWSITLEQALVAETLHTAKDESLYFFYSFLKILHHKQKSAEISA